METVERSEGGGRKTVWTFYLNDTTCWRNVPVWEYMIGGYQVIKKWLSCCPARLNAELYTQQPIFV